MRTEDFFRRSAIHSLPNVGGGQSSNADVKRTTPNDLAPMTCAMPKKPFISSGDMSVVYERDRVRQTARPAQSSTHHRSVNDPARNDPPLYVTAATFAVVLAEEATVS